MIKPVKKRSYAQPITVYRVTLKTDSRNEKDIEKSYVNLASVHRSPSLVSICKLCLRFKNPFKPGFHMSEKSQTVGDFAFCRFFG